MARRVGERRDSVLVRFAKSVGRGVLMVLKGLGYALELIVEIFSWIK